MRFGVRVSDIDVFHPQRSVQLDGQHTYKYGLFLEIGYRVLHYIQDVVHHPLFE